MGDQSIPDSGGVQAGLVVPTPTMSARRSVDGSSSTWIEMFAILIIPFALTYTFGSMAGDQRQGWAIFAAMAGILVVGAIVAMAGETGGNPIFPAGVYR